MFARVKAYCSARVGRSESLQIADAAVAEDLYFSGRPETCRILAAITFHYDEQRLKYLAQVVAEFAAYPVARCQVKIFTNTIDVDRIEAALDIVPSDFFELISCTDLANPFDLSWSHKETISSAFLNEAEPFTHFIYSEDDLRISYANFCYFLSARAELAVYGVIPSFARSEWSSLARAFVTSDNGVPTKLRDELLVATPGRHYAPLQNSHCGVFILDRQLALEYIQTRSFDRDKSRTLTELHIRERAAMGLMNENRPQGFDTRYVVRIDPLSKRIRPEAVIPHLPNNYADVVGSPFGCLLLSSLFAE